MSPIEQLDEFLRTAQQVEQFSVFFSCTLAICQLSSLSLRSCDSFVRPVLLPGALIYSGVQYCTLQSRDSFICYPVVHLFTLVYCVSCALGINCVQQLSALMDLPADIYPAKYALF